MERRPRILLVATRSPDRHLGGSAMRVDMVHRALERLGEVTVALVDEVPADRPGARPDPSIAVLRRRLRALPYRWHVLRAFVGGRGRDRTRWGDRLAVGSWTLPEGLAEARFDLGWFEKATSLQAWPGDPPDRVVLDLDDLEEDTRGRSAALVDAWVMRGLRRRLSRRAGLLAVCSADDAARLPVTCPAGLVPNAAPPVPTVGDPPTAANLLFVAQMGYPPNRDGLTWFVRSVLPRLQEAEPDVRVRVVGPGAEHLPADVRAAVDAVGAVAEVGEHYAWSRAVVVPLLVGSGTSLKVLDAFAHGRAVVATSTGLRGLGRALGTAALVADDAPGFAGACVDALRAGRAEILGRAGRALATGPLSAGQVEGYVRSAALSALGPTRRVWIDISSVHGRSGTPHGIARVEAGLARAIGGSDATSSAVWVDGRGVHAGRRCDLLAVGDGRDSTRPAFDPRGGPGETTVLGRMRRAIEHGAQRLSPPLARTVDGAVAGVLARRDRVRVRRDRRRWGRVARPGDAVLVIGHDWNNGTVAALAGLPAAVRPRLWVVVHDVVPLTRPQFVPDDAARARFTAWLRQVTAVAEAVLVVSEATAADIAAASDAGLIPRPRRVAVVHPAVDLEPVGAPVALPGGPFVVYVATIEVRKNHRTLLQAVRAAGRAGERVPTVVWVGSWGWGVDDLRADVESGPTPGLVHLDGLPDAQMRWLVEHAAAVVFPSWCEGYGLPVAEARSLGTPVFAADLPALREAAGGVGAFLDPGDVDAWRRALVQIAAEPPPRTIPAVARSWTDAAVDVLAVMAARQGGGPPEGPPT